MPHEFNLIFMIFLSSHLPLSKSFVIKGVSQEALASGLRTILPSIPGVGLVRLRYPIVPSHAMGSSLWKELEAFKEIWEQKLKDVSETMTVI